MTKHDRPIHAKNLLLFMAISFLMLVAGFSLTTLANAQLELDTLYVGHIGWPRNFDPIMACDRESENLISTIYDTLICMGEPVTDPSGTQWDVHEQYWAFSPALATNVPGRVDITESHFRHCEPF